MTTLTTKTGLAFMSTATFVTPATGVVNIPCDPNSAGDLPQFTTGTHNAGPFTINGYTVAVGWQTNKTGTQIPNNTNAARDRSASVNTDIAGTQTNIGGTQAYLKIQFTGALPGTYKFWAGFCDQLNGTSGALAITLEDTNNVLASFSKATSLNTTQVVGADSTVYANSAGWSGTTDGTGMAILVTTDDTTNSGGPVFYLNCGTSANNPVSFLAFQYIPNTVIINGAVATATGAVSGSGTVTASSVVVPSGGSAQMLVVWGVDNSSGADSITGVTFGGVSLTKKLDYQSPSAQGFTSLWYLLNPNASTANVVATIAGGGGTQHLIIYTLQNVNQTTPFPQTFTKNASGSGNVSQAITGTANNLIIDTLWDTNNATTEANTTAIGQSLIGGVFVSGNHQFLGSAVPSATITPGWHSGNNLFGNYVVVEVGEGSGVLIQSATNSGSVVSSFTVTLTGVTAGNFLTLQLSGVATASGSSNVSWTLPTDTNVGTWSLAPNALGNNLSGTGSSCSAVATCINPGAGTHTVTVQLNGFTLNPGHATLVEWGASTFPVNTQPDVSVFNNVLTTNSNAATTATDVAAGLTLLTFTQYPGAGVANAGIAASGGYSTLYSQNVTNAGDIGVLHAYLLTNTPGAQSTTVTWTDASTISSQLLLTALGPPRKPSITYMSAGVVGPI